MTSDVPLTRSRWSFERVARLAFLVGLGFDAKRIARDPLIASTPANVYRQAQRFGIAFRDVGPGLPSAVAHRCETAAAKRGLSHEGLVRQLVLAAGSHDGLIDNILDDEA